MLLIKKISLLDCTLRDGGYVNNWRFGSRTIYGIIEKLFISNVEYIECGYLSQKSADSEDYTKYLSFDAIARVVPKSHENKQLAVMINFGEYAIEALPEADCEKPIVRLCFHKKDAKAALKYCLELKNKGYRVFVQPMGSMNYSDKEFIELIDKVNEMKPDCFYIVDSFGVMESYDFKRLISIADYNLGTDILLGYHAHNNLQQAYGNAKLFVEQDLKHDIILDASVYGMGRGAGNLNMELFASFLNKNYDKNYDIDAFLDIMDDYLRPIFAENYWGYSLAFYLSAQYNCHPNYANYFAEKNTLTNKSMKQLLASLPENIKISYSAKIAEEFYLNFQKRLIDDHEAVSLLKQEIYGRKVLILAPGKSLTDSRAQIETFINNNKPIIIAINILPEGYECDYLFCNNEKRLRYLVLPEKTRLILSSNIDGEEIHKAIRINYSSYLIDGASAVSDNPTLMIIQLLFSIGMTQINIAGFDGYSLVPQDNYFTESLSMGSSLAVKIEKNKYISQVVQALRSRIHINFVTKSLYE